MQEYISCFLRACNLLSCTSSELSVPICLQAVMLVVYAVAYIFHLRDYDNLDCGQLFG